MSALLAGARSVRDLFARELQRADAESGPLPAREQLKLALLLVVVAFGLAFLHYFGTRTKAYKTKPLFELLVDDGDKAYAAVFQHAEYGAFARDAWWTLSIFVCYAALPLLVLVLMRPRATLADVGLSPQRALSHWRLYVALLLLMAIPIAIAASNPSFVAYYPMNKQATASLSRFLLWEAIYLPQFFAVELLFRGVLILPFQRRMGALAILVPVLPYCMIHFGKPLPEALGAVVAALVLGTLALVTRTIWLGVALHMTIALTMDTLAVVVRGGFAS